MMVCRTSPPWKCLPGPPGQALHPGGQGRKVLAVLGGQAPGRRHHQAVPGQDQRLLDVLDLTDEVVQQPAQLSGRISLCHYPAPLSVGSLPGAPSGSSRSSTRPRRHPCCIMVSMLRVASGDRTPTSGAVLCRRGLRRSRPPGPAIAGPGWPAEPGWASRDGCRTTRHRALGLRRRRAGRDRAGRPIRPRRLGRDVPGRNHDAASVSHGAAAGPTAPRTTAVPVPRPSAAAARSPRARRVGPGAAGHSPVRGPRAASALGARRDGGQPVTSGQAAETTVARPVVSPGPAGPPLPAARPRRTAAGPRPWCRRTRTGGARP